MRGQNKFLKMILFLGDIFIVYAALFLALAVRNRHLALKFDSFFYSFFILYVFWLIVIFVLNLYDLHFFKKPIDFFFSLAIFSVLAFLSGVAYFYFRPQPDITPKTILILDVVIFDILFVCWRYVFNLFLEAKGIKDKIIIIGNCLKLKEIMPQINRSYEVSAIFCPDSSEVPEFIPKEIFVSDTEELKNIVLQKKVNSVLLAVDVYSKKDLIKEIFSVLPLTLNYIDFNDLYEFITKKVSLEQLDEAWFLQKISKPEDKLEQIVKRLFDIILSSVGLLLFVIFFPFIVVAIKIDSEGNIFYTQKRVGKNGKLFLLHKFRTMKDDKNQDKKIWREKNKNNVTGVGKILRRIHLDELPQSWSILEGDLSFVGPRPEWSELAKVFEKEIPFYKQRYLIKPGLIGWAQINFPASKSINEAKEKFEYDLYYIKNHSLLLDLEIILKTMKLFFW
ncbi:MAG: exopolysaccharide biosynthesis polyprenyl glycosylphosphotransferase [Candidatus Staskawiczbacteria bacterium]|jgi:exopolysaccharide biosynthesis polyprenyl glycosylphosphotransferase